MNHPPVSPLEAPGSTAISLEFIRAFADGDTGGGADEVGAFHRAVFLNRHSQDLERFQQQRRIHEDRLASLEPRLDRLRLKLASEEPWVPVLEDGSPDTQPTAPWNGWDRAMFASAVTAIVCLLVFGVLNVSFNLLESGIVTFTDHPFRAYFWAALLPVGALAVKVGWDFLRERRQRTGYLWTCLATGVIAVLVWVAAYATVYPTLSKTTDEQIESLSVFDTSRADGDSGSRLSFGRAKRIDMILVAAQALAEICLSAALGMYLTQLYAKHRPVRLARNPTFAQLDEERRLLEDGVSQERLALAEVKGNEARLEHQLSVFVSYAKTLFQKEAALRRDRGQQKRLILDEITEQLRTRLEAVDKDGRPGGNGNNPSLTLGRQEAQ